MLKNAHAAGPTNLPEAAPLVQGTYELRRAIDRFRRPQAGSGFRGRAASQGPTQAPPEEALRSDRQDYEQNDEE